MNRICAQRGWSSRAPENTLSAIRMALNDPIINAIKIDVQMTRDKKLVLIHDFELQRTSNGAGRVNAYHLNTLKRMDFGSWFSPLFEAEQIPTLEEALALVNGRKELILEIKSLDDDIELAEELVKTLRTYPFCHSLRIKSLHHGVIFRIRQLEPRLKIGLMAYGIPHNFVRSLKETGSSFASVHYPYIQSEFVELMQQQNIGLYAWTVNDPNKSSALSRLSKNITLISDVPDTIYQELMR